MLGFADVLVEELGDLDVEEITASVLVPGNFGDLLRERVRNSLGDEGLTAAWGPVKKNALRSWQLVLGEKIVVEERELDGIHDLFDLRIESANIGIGDVGDFFEHEFFDIWARQLFEKH